MKGIVLAGGTGSRLWPITLGTSKQLMPIYDKPMIYYPLSTLMMAKISEILFITTNEHLEFFVNLLGDGSNLGMKFEFIVQQEPNGLAEAFLLGEDFIGDESVALVLGDNIFHGVGLGASLTEKVNFQEGALIFAYHVSNPSDYGVVEFGSGGIARSIEEKPESPKSNFAIPGLYFYDNSVVSKAKNVTPSSRGELEISSINQLYLESGDLHVEILDRGTVWFDTGTIDSMVDAAEYVRVIEARQGFKIGCIEEIAWRNGWITNQDLNNAAKRLSKSNYGSYLQQLANFN